MTERATMTGAICSLLPKGEAPASIMLLPSGKVELRDSRDPREPWLNDQPEVVRARTMALILNGMSAGLPIDYDHATDLAAPHGRPAPAAGWMKSFRVENGEIWADVEWTEPGAKALAAGEWRYISPVFDFTKKERRVICIRSAALTNNPALFDTAIAAAEAAEVERSDMELGKLAKLFGCAEGATLEAICAAAEKKNMDSDEFCAKMAAKFGCAKGSSYEDICAAAEKHTIKAKAASDDEDDDKAAARLIASGKVVSNESYKALVTDVNAIKADRARDRASVKVDAAIQEGKLTKAQRDWGVAYCAADEKAFDEFIAKQPVIKLGEDGHFRGTPPGADGAPILTTDEQAICAAFGLKPEDYVKQKATLGKTATFTGMRPDHSSDRK